MLTGMSERHQAESSTRRAPVDDLLHCRGEVWERVTVRECGQSVGTYHGIELGSDFPLYFKIHGHGKRKEVIAETGC